MFDFNEWRKVQKHINRYPDILPAVKTKKSLLISVQAGSLYRCEPDVDDAEYYSKVEVKIHRHFLPLVDHLELLKPYCLYPDESINYTFVNVPVEVINQFINDNGGAIMNSDDYNLKLHGRVFHPALENTDTSIVDMKQGDYALVNDVWRRKIAPNTEFFSAGRWDLVDDYDTLLELERFVNQVRVPEYLYLGLQ